MKREGKKKSSGSFLVMGRCTFLFGAKSGRTALDDASQMPSLQDQRFLRFICAWKPYQVASLYLVFKTDNLFVSFFTTAPPSPPYFYNSSSTQLRSRIRALTCQQKRVMIRLLSIRLFPLALKPRITKQPGVCYLCHTWQSDQVRQSSSLASVRTKVGSSHAAMANHYDVVRAEGQHTSPLIWTYCGRK